MPKGRCDVNAAADTACSLNRCRAKLCAMTSVERLKDTRAMKQDSEMTVTFRCLPELLPILPSPLPAVQGLPGWFKSLPLRAMSTTDQSELMTVKKCPPFIDAMGYGFL